MSGHEPGAWLRKHRTILQIELDVIQEYLALYSEANAPEYYLLRRAVLLKSIERINEELAKLASSMSRLQERTIQYAPNETKKPDGGEAQGNRGAKGGGATNPR